MRGRIGRRAVLAGGTVAVLGLAAGGAGYALRREVHREPHLTEAHIAGLADRFAAPATAPRILFVGNSYTMGHDVPGRVAARAAAAGRPVETAMAAAHGARLGPTARIGSLRRLIARGDWNVVVLQDFSLTAISPWDAFWSERAMEELGALAAPARVVLFPPLVRAVGHPLYRGEAGLLERAPASPGAFTEVNTAYYGRIARENGYTLAPLGPAWLAAMEADRPVFAEDGHHASPEGAALVARVLWETIAPLLPPRG